MTTQLLISRNLTPKKKKKEKGVDDPELKDAAYMSKLRSFLYLDE